MESKYIEYDFLKSYDRIKEIIGSSDDSFEELNVIPSRDKLTFANGFYVNCSALFVDIRNSSTLPGLHTRPKLAKLYRVFISEVVAVMTGDENCAEVNVVGDCVSSILNTPYRRDIDSAFAIAYTTSSLIDIINYQFKQNRIEQISVGIGMSYGRALTIKAGFSGSGINYVVWMGDVVNEASRLASYGNQTGYDKEIMVSRALYDNLNEDNKKLLAWNLTRNCFHGNIVRTDMNQWFRDNCK